MCIINIEVLVIECVLYAMCIMNINCLGLNVFICEYLFISKTISVYIYTCLPCHVCLRTWYVFTVTLHIELTYHFTYYSKLNA